MAKNGPSNVAASRDPAATDGGRKVGDLTSAWTSAGYRTRFRNAFVFHQLTARDEGVAISALTRT